MTKELHHLIDRNAEQPVINERIAGILEKHDISDKDKEERIRYLERTVAKWLGAIGAVTGVLAIIVLLLKIINLMGNK